LAVWWCKLDKDAGVSRLTKYKNYFICFFFIVKGI
jgi:hypothetical protein